MYKIAILGCENSHADSFLSLIRAGRYPELEVIGVYSEELAAAEKLKETYGVEILSDYKDAVGKVDGVMITARHGDNHYKYAKPYLPYGIPMFIDKPITVDEAEAVAFMREARDNGVRLCGGSTCARIQEAEEMAETVRNKELGDIIGGYLACPISMENAYGGFFFYAQHLVEVMTKVFGGEVRSVSAKTTGGRMSFIAQYDDFDITANYTHTYHYYVAAVGSKDKMAKSVFLNTCQENFANEMDAMMDLLHGKEMSVSYDSFIRPVFIMNAINKAAQTGLWTPVQIVSV